MNNRLYTAAVLLVWLASMSWLFTERILPNFLGGDAPSSISVQQLVPVAWSIEMDGEPCGLAVTQVVPGSHGVKEVHSVVRLDSLRAPESAPMWLAPAFSSLRSLSLSIRSCMTYDALNSLSSFLTTVRVNRMETPVRLNGRIDAGILRLVARVGSVTHKLEYPWSGDAALAGELSPTSRLLPLYEGRKWTQEMFSPLASPSAPLEMIEAEVTARVRWSDETDHVDAWRVEYRALRKTGSTEEGRKRAVLFVALDGRVLEHQALVMGSKFSLRRLGAEESNRLADEMLDLSRHSSSDAVFVNGVAGDSTDQS